MERKAVRFSIWVFIALFIGGAVQIIPMIFIKSNIPTIDAVTPYTPLELEGRDIYIKEGCYTCHSQQISPFRWETDRYGDYSKIGEFVYDHPFLWGSRRTGPDLARAGYVNGPMYKNAAWHYNHFMDPQKMNEQSIMPQLRLVCKRRYQPGYDSRQRSGPCKPWGYPTLKDMMRMAVDELLWQAEQIVAELKASGIDIEPTKQMVAMIAYLHKLGGDIEPNMNPKPESHEAGE